MFSGGMQIPQGDWVSTAGIFGISVTSEATTALPIAVFPVPDDIHQILLYSFFIRLQQACNFLSALITYEDVLYSRVT
jgi:hypothetical protein